MTAPDPEGRGAARAMQFALRDAGLDTSRIDYINAHGTSTPLNDAAESEAIAKLFGESRPPVVSIKGVTGHPLGAAGALEAAAVLLSMEKRLIPPSRGTTQIDPAMSIDVVIGDPPALRFDERCGERREPRVIGGLQILVIHPFQFRRIYV